MFDAVKHQLQQVGYPLPMPETDTLLFRQHIAEYMENHSDKTTYS